MWKNSHRINSGRDRSCLKAGKKEGGSNENVTSEAVNNLIRHQSLRCLPLLGLVFTLVLYRVQCLDKILSILSWTVFHKKPPAAPEVWREPLSGPQTLRSKHHFPSLPSFARELRKKYVTVTRSPKRDHFCCHCFRSPATDQSGASFFPANFNLLLPIRQMGSSRNTSCAKEAFHQHRTRRSQIIMRLTSHRSLKLLSFGFFLFQKESKSLNMSSSDVIGGDCLFVFH